MGIRKLYSEQGVEEYYLSSGDSYRNPHEEQVSGLIRHAKEQGHIGHRVLDLCCGSGEVTQCLNGHDVTGADPFTGNAYYRRTGRRALDCSFLDIAKGALDGCRFDTVICSFALHLCEESLLPQVLYQLGRISDTLIVISPNKRPDCDGWFWTLTDETLLNRVRMRIYK